MPKVSILVPRLPTTVIPRCLDSIYQVASLGKVQDIKFQEGTLLADQRNNLVKFFLSSDSEFALFLDSDMIFPPNLVDIMVSTMNRNNIDILTGLYFTKHEHDPVPLISKHIGNGYFIPKTPEILEFFSKYQEVSKLYFHAPDEQAIIEIDGCGSGCLMVRRKVLETIEPPWFSFEKEYSEDYYFCLKAKEYGFKIYADMRILPEHCTISSIGINEFLLANPLDEFEFRKRLSAVLIYVASELLQKPKQEIAERIPFGPQLMLQKFKEGAKDLFELEESIYDLIVWNCGPAFSKLLKVIFRWIGYFKQMNKPVLCFGSGLGTDAMFMAKHGVEDIYYYDRSKLLNKFASKLFEVEKVNVKIAKTLNEIPHVCAIISLDVFEHMEKEELDKVLSILDNKLVKDGIFIIHAPGPDTLHPFHQSYNMDLLLGSKYDKLSEFVWRKR